jgi:uncharacterized membrane protein YoaK (UPF0700 family)
MFESILLTLGATLLRSHHPTGGYIVSAACGLQNAMASSYSGAVLRTTHVTGMFTDIGAALGHFLRGIPVDWIRVKLYTLIICSFLFGGIVGTLLFDALSYDTLFLPAGFTGAVAASYTLYASRNQDTP